MFCVDRIAVFPGNDKSDMIMGKIKRIFFVFIIGLFLPGISFSQEVIYQEGIARNFLGYLVNNEVTEMMGMFSESFLGQVPEEQIKEIAGGLEKQLGKFSHVSRVLHESTGQYHTVILVCVFGEMELGLRISLDQEDKVAGFFITMAPPESFTPPPAWVDTTAFSEIPAEIDCGDISLPAMLSIPLKGSNFPVVVLVHGSGSHDMDQSIGPNKIFRDIAWGLSSQGIAVLRYEKRSFRNHHTINTEDFSVWDEAGRDAVYAVNMAMQIPEADPGRVYLLGHSLGGMIAPRIALEVPGLEGVISMAGSPRQLYEIIPGQLEYLISLRDEPGEAALEQLEEAREVAEILARKRNEADAIYKETLLGMPPSYLADMNRHDTGEIAAGLPQRVLILHGERDYQVTMEDYEAWKRALNDHPATTFILYPEMNHLFFPGQEPSVPEEYFFKNNVGKPVIDDIVKWIMEEK